LGCGSKPPPPPVDPPLPPVEPAPEPPKPPPPKKCESMEDDCVADAKTRAKIAKTSFAFTPVAGWKYAQTPQATIAQPFELGRAQAFTAFDVDAKKDKEARDAALG